MNGFFSFFGKAVFGILVVGLLVGGGYYVGKGKFPTYNPPAAVSTTAPSATPESTSPSPTIAAQQINGGGLSGTSFGTYILVVPNSWTVKKETNAGVSEKITITRGAYSMAIYQAATGGGQCLYPGDTPAEMSSSFGAYTTMYDGSGNVYRRATPTGSVSGFTVCQKGESFFGLPTMYGHVSYSAPAVPDASILKEMDAIFATLKKV